MLHKSWCLLPAIVAVLFCSNATAEVLIDPETNNGSFEFAGGALNTTKVQVWDGSPDVDNWSTWTEVSTADTDSGVENTGNASDGTMIAFMQGGNAVHNMTTWTAAEGDVFVFSWDHVLRADREHTVGLVYDNGGTITTLLNSEVPYTGTLETIEGSYVIPAGSPAIGNTIGLGVVSPGSYPEIDNFVLTVNEGGPIVTGDVDGDGDVDLTDFGTIRDNFRLSPALKSQGDLTGADIVDLNDFLLWRDNHPFPGGAAVVGQNQLVPEPATWLLGLLGMMAVGRRAIRQ